MTKLINEFVFELHCYHNYWFHDNGKHNSKLGIIWI